MHVDNFGCCDSTIKVASGHYFDLANPTADMVDINSIASALGKICRYGGHCPRFYSVAEHCIHATEMALSDGHPDWVLKAILLHDAAEAYVGDVVKPLKLMLPEYSVAEDLVSQAIAEKYALNDRLESIVKQYDRQMLKSEKEAFWPEDGRSWAGFHNLPVRKVHFLYHAPEAAKLAFLYLAKSIGIKD